MTNMAANTARSRAAASEKTAQFLPNSAFLRAWSRTARKLLVSDQTPRRLESVPRIYVAALSPMAARLAIRATASSSGTGRSVVPIEIASGGSHRRQARGPWMGSRYREKALDGQARRAGRHVPDPVRHPAREGVVPNGEAPTP
jgi:hypothetical protein